jgi:FKBP-type peptidyl-prolyl cis-trans isomerase
MEELNIDDFAAGMSDALKGVEPQITHEEANTVIQEKIAVAQNAQKKAAESAKGEADKFLAENGARPEVVVLDSGLQYEIITEGNGAKPADATAQVSVHYHGTTLEGKVFDSSVERGQPASFGLNQVIKGWTEGVQLMNVGSKFKFFIPADLAYGDQGAGADIKPGATLIFEVELLEING